MVREAMFAKESARQRVNCLLCAHGCALEPGEWGICGVRRNEDGVLTTHVYGHAAALNIDPIEKKPLFHFLPGSLSLSIGTAGCNFRCDYCQNWELSQRRCNGLDDSVSIESGPPLLPGTLVELALRHGTPSISYTYSEPTVFVEYALETMELAKAAGLRNVFVSNGYMSAAALRELAPTLDAINIDLKSFREEFYARHCQARLKPVLETIALALELGIWVEVTTLLIPRENDEPMELMELTQFLASLSPALPWHVTAFHPDYKMRHGQPTSAAALAGAYELGRESGLEYVYTGNLKDKEHTSTYCPNCGDLLIERAWGPPSNLKLVGGTCPGCAQAIDGVWE